MERFKYVHKNKIDELPRGAGVYTFKSNEGLLYIGKAINIQGRVKNHFNQPSYRDDLFIDKVSKIGYFETGSEIEALVLEASLIKKYQPKFNVVWRDDKNYFYVAITKDKQPAIYITHQKNENAEYVGPFVEGTALKKTLRFLRRAFPYYTVKKHPKTKCTWCHLGLCPGPNPNLKEHKKNIKKLILILQGKSSTVLNSLKKEMNQLPKENKFEEAAGVRDRIHNLQQVMAHSGVIEPIKTQTDNGWTKTQKILQGLTGLNKEISKIECYDVSNIQGKSATGSMVIFVNGKSDNKQYRKFKIKLEGKPNDIAMLKETLERRLSHKEWSYPEIILIDGGIAQLNVAINVKNSNSGTRDIKVISIAKRNKDLYIEGRKDFIPLKSLPREIYNLILQLDDEAHRFAIAYHKKLRKKALLK
jgi:excinuclease ABC subunit C